MSDIYFIRHGQASFGDDNYDRLSPLGVKQAQVLACHLAETGKFFDAIYYGEMERQQKTAQEFINHCKKNGIPVVRPDVCDAFNEYDSIAVWQALIPEMSAEEPSLAREVEKLSGDQKAFQSIFSRLMLRWVKGNYSCSNIPHWDDFTRRVNQGIKELAACHGVKKRLAVFTSGGPISVSVQAALGLSDEKTLDIAWQIMNASITRIKYSRRGTMLAEFNNVAHLELEKNQSLLTYR